MRPENLFKLTPELKAAITRHPAACRQTGPGQAGDAAPSPPKSGSGKPGQRAGWRCTKCDATFTAWAAAERHRHRSEVGGDVGVIELVLS